MSPPRILVDRDVCVALWDALDANKRKPWARRCGNDVRGALADVAERTVESEELVLTYDPDDAGKFETPKKASGSSAFDAEDATALLCAARIALRASKPGQLQDEIANFMRAIVHLSDTSIVDRLTILAEIGP